MIFKIIILNLLTDTLGAAVWFTPITPTNCTPIPWKSDEQYCCENQGQGPRCCKNSVCMTSGDICVFDTECPNADRLNWEECQSILAPGQLQTPLKSWILERTASTDYVLSSRNPNIFSEMYTSEYLSIYDEKYGYTCILTECKLVEDDLTLPFDCQNSIQSTRGQIDLETQQVSISGTILIDFKFKAACRLNIGIKFVCSETINVKFEDCSTFTCDINNQNIIQPVFTTIMPIVYTKLIDSTTPLSHQYGFFDTSNFCCPIQVVEIVPLDLNDAIITDQSILDLYGIDFDWNTMKVQTKVGFHDKQASYNFYLKINMQNNIDYYYKQESEIATATKLSFHVGCGNTTVVGPQYVQLTIPIQIPKFTYYFDVDDPTSEIVIPDIYSNNEPSCGICQRKIYKFPSLGLTDVMYEKFQNSDQIVTKAIVKNEYKGEHTSYFFYVGTKVGRVDVDPLQSCIDGLFIVNQVSQSKLYKDENEKITIFQGCKDLSHKYDQFLVTNIPLGQVSINNIYNYPYFDTSNREYCSQNVIVQLNSMVVTEQDLSTQGVVTGPTTIQEIDFNNYLIMPAGQTEPKSIVDLVQTNKIQLIKFTLKTTFQNGYREDDPDKQLYFIISQQININVQCMPSIILPDILNQKNIHVIPQEIDNSNFEFAIPTCSHLFDQDQYCCNIKYEIVDETNSVINILEAEIILDPITNKLNLSKKDRSTIETKLYYIKISNDGGTPALTLKITVMKSQEIKWDVVHQCNNPFVKFIETSSTDDKQEVPQSDKGGILTEFVIKDFTISPQNCILRKIVIVESDDIINGLQDLRFEQVDITKNPMKIIPADKTIHMVYSFYILYEFGSQDLTLNVGGHIISQGQKHLLVGCPVTSGIFEETTLSITQDQKEWVKKVGDSEQRIFEIQSPILNPARRSYCKNHSYTLENINGGNIWINTLQCNDSPCSQIDTSSSLQERNITFQITYKIEGEISITSGIIKLKIECSNLTNTLKAVPIASDNLNNKYMLLNGQSDYLFQRFECTYRVCCDQNKYIAIYDKKNFEQIKVFGEAQKLSYNDQRYQMFFSLPNYQTYIQQFHIQATNQIGQVSYSEMITIEIRFECSYDQFWYKEDKNLTKILINENINNPNRRLILDISNRFQTLSASKYNSTNCPISAFAITTVYDNVNKVTIPFEVYQTIFDLNAFTGTIQLKNVVNLIDQYFIYFDVFNTKIWSNLQSQFLIEVRIYDGRKKFNVLEQQKLNKQKPIKCLVGMTPEFDKPLPSVPIDLDYSQNLTIFYQLPDKNPCVRLLQVRGKMPLYMNFDVTNLRFQINQCKIFMSEIIKLEILLFNHGQQQFTNSISFNIEKTKPCPEFKEPLGVWDININKVVVESYVFNFPELPETISILEIYGLTDEMVYDEKIRSISVKQSKILKLFKNNIDKQKNIFLRIVLQNNEKIKQEVVLFTSIMRPETFPVDGSIFKEKENFVGKIDEITSGGKLSIQFNSNLQRNLQQINNSTLQIYVDPNSLNIQNPNFNLSKLNLTWELKEIQNNQLTIQLNFTHGYNISANGNNDQLICNILNPKAFYSDELKKYIHSSSWRLQKPIRKQLSDTDFNRDVQETAKILNAGMLWALFAMIILNILINKGAHLHMLQLISALQILLHLPLIKVDTPAITSTIIEIVLPVAMFDILDLLQDTSFYRFIMKFFDDYNLQSQMNYEDNWSQSINLGYRNYNSIQNLSSVSFILFFLYVKGLICTCLFIHQLYSGIYSQKYKKLKKYTSINEFFNVFMETYFELILACYFNAMYGQKTLTNQFPKYFGNMQGAISVILMPLICVFVINQDFDTLNLVWFQNNFGSFYQDIRLLSKYHLIAKLIYIIRRAAFLLVVIFCQNQIILQIQLCFIINILISTYQAAIKPMYIRRRNQIETFNELIIQSSTIHLFCFTIWVEDPLIQEKVGVSFVMHIALMILVNSVFIFQVLGLYIKLWVQFYYLRLKLKLEQINLIPDCLKSKPTTLNPQDEINTKQPKKQSKNKSQNPHKKKQIKKVTQALPNILEVSLEKEESYSINLISQRQNIQLVDLQSNDGKVLDANNENQIEEIKNSNSPSQNEEVLDANYYDQDNKINNYNSSSHLGEVVLDANYENKNEEINNSNSSSQNVRRKADRQFQLNMQSQHENINSTIVIDQQQFNTQTQSQSEQIKPKVIKKKNKTKTSRFKMYFTSRN